MSDLIDSSDLDFLIPSSSPSKTTAAAHDPNAPKRRPGRPRLHPEGYTPDAKLSVYLGEENQREVREMAERLDCSVSHLLRYAWQAVRGEVAHLDRLPGSPTKTNPGEAQDWDYHEG